MKRLIVGCWMLIVGVSAQAAFVSSTTWAGGMDDGFVVQTRDYYNTQDLYWCCKQKGSGKAAIVGFDRYGYEVDYSSFLPGVYRKTWTNVPDSDAMLGDECPSVPSTVNGLSVVEVGSEAFAGTRINSAFLPSTLLSVGFGTFKSCHNLIGLFLPDGLKTIGESAFEDCAELMIINIPASVTKIGVNAFCGCEKLRSNGWIVIDGCLVDAKGSAGDVVIPDGIRLIADGAFAGCTGLASVKMPQSVKSIGNDAFMGCTSLREVDIPASVTNIGSRAFWHCGSLTEVVIPSSVKDLGSEAFGYCAGLKKVTMPAGMSCGLWSGVFADWFGERGYYSSPTTYTAPVEEVVISEGSQYIYSSMFEKCATLRKVTLPTGLLGIGSSAFRNCSALADVNIPSSVTDVSGSAFEGTALWLENPDGAIVVDCCLVGIKGAVPTELRIPETVRIVAGYVLGDASGLKVVMFPDSVEVLSPGSFHGCASLERIDFEGPPPSGVAKADIHSSTCVRYNVAYAGQWLSVVESCGWTNATAYVPTKPDGGPYVATVGDYEWSFWVRNGKAEIADVDMWWNPQCAVNPKPVGSVVVPEILGGCPVTEIGSYAFYECGSLTSVEIPEGVTRIGIRAFEGCDLAEVTLPKTMAMVGSCAFEGCPIGKLTLLGTSFPELEVEDDISGGSSWKYRSGLSVVEYYDYYTGGTKAVLQTIFGRQEKDVWNLDVWGGNAERAIASMSWDYYDCEIIVGDDMESWNDGIAGESSLWFYGYGRMEGVGIWQMANVFRPGWHVSTDEYLGGNPEDHFVCGHYPAVSGCVTIPASCLGVRIDGVSPRTGQRGCGFSAVSELILADGIKYVGNELFMDGKTLICVTLPAGLERIESRAFMNCTNLRTINIPSTVSEIGWSAFEGCAILEVSFEGNASDATSLGLSGLPKTCTLRVARESTGWDVEIPGTWKGLRIDWIAGDNPIPELGPDAKPAEILAALEGAADVKLSENITDAAAYGLYREWALKIGAAEVNASPNAWISFAVDSAALLAKEPLDEDLKIETFVPSSTVGSFDFTVSVKDMMIGPGATSGNLKKIFALEGAASLDPSGFSSDNIEVDVMEPRNGNVKFTARPTLENATSFFMRMRTK